MITDGVAALLALAFTLAMLAAGGLGTPGPDTRALDALGVLLAILSALPVIVVRRAPGAVYGVTAVASLALLALGYPFDVPVGPVIAAYRLADAVGGDTPARRRSVARAAVVAFVPLAILTLPVSGEESGTGAARHGGVGHHLRVRLDRRGPQPAAPRADR